MPPLAPRTRSLVSLSAALAAGRETALREALDEAEREAEASQVEECLLQAYLFLGFPAVLGAFAMWRERHPAPAEPAGEASGALEVEAAEWRRRGERLCERVYGSAYGKLRHNLRRLHPELDRWMVDEGYGKVLARPGLDPGTRELCIVGLLAVAGQDLQLHSHLRGALQVGAGEREVEAALDVALQRVPDPASGERVRRLWQRVRAARGEE